LSPNACKLFLAVARRFNGGNNGEITFACSEGVIIGLSRDQTARAFAELQAKGFLRCTRASAFTLKTKAARCWELTNLPRLKQPATHDYRRWSRSRNSKHGRTGTTHSRAGATEATQTQ
jgi:hypothetical protein